MLRNEDNRPQSATKPAGFRSRAEAEQGSIDLSGRRAVRVRRPDSVGEGTQYFALGYRNGRETLEGPESWCYTIDGYAQ